jgi:hypothetical protein
MSRQGSPPLLSRPADLSNAAAFVKIHLALNIDIVKAMPVPWETFIGIAPLPGIPTLRELFFVALQHPQHELLTL